MSFFSGLVLFASMWFLLLLMALPLRMSTQSEVGERVAGTPGSAPVNPMIGKKFFWVTVVTLLLWLPLVLFIEYGPLTIEDLDFYGRGRLEQG